MNRGLAAVECRLAGLSDEVEVVEFVVEVLLFLVLVEVCG